MNIIPLTLLVIVQFLLQLLLVRRKHNYPVQGSLLVFLGKLLFMSVSIVGVNMVFMLLSAYLGDVKAFNFVTMLFVPLGFFVSIIVEYIFLKYLIKQKLYLSLGTISIITVFLGSALGACTLFLNPLS